MSTITQEELKTLLAYDPETGFFTRVKSTSSRTAPGMMAGSIEARGYVRIEINGKKYAAHRLAWLYVYGAFPSQQIDHINGVKGDNRICNLRIATNAENQQNVRPKSNNKTGYVGVDYLGGLGRKKRWRAGIKVGGSFKSLGYYASMEEAVAARKAAEGRYHPFRAALDGQPAPGKEGA